MRRTRWHTLAAVLAVESVGGLAYAFSLYSLPLQRRFHYSQGQLDSLADLQNIGACLTLQWFLLLEYTGPAPLILLTVFIAAPAWFIVAMALDTQTHLDLPFGVMAVLSFAQLHFPAVTDVTCVAVAAAAFPERRGLVVGMVKAMIGLSGSLASAIFVGFFSPLAETSIAAHDAAISRFLIFLAIEIAVLAGVSSAIIRFPQPGAATRAANEPRATFTLSVAVGILYARSHTARGDTWHTHLAYPPRTSLLHPTPMRLFPVAAESSSSSPPSARPS